MENLNVINVILFAVNTDPRKEMINFLSLNLLLCFCRQSSPQRIDPNIVPISYNLTIELEASSFHTQHFKGEVDIILKLLKERESTLPINAVNLNFREITLKTLSRTLEFGSSSEDISAQTMTLKFNEKLPAEELFLSITFRGSFGKKWVGLYKSTYKTKAGQIEKLVTTQLETNFARSVFPCFDEPVLKAKFTVTVVHPKEYTAWSNTPQAENQDKGALKKVTFKTTPKMSTYLIGVVVAKFTCDHDASISVCSTPESSSDRKYALGMAPKLLKYMEKFTGIPFKSMGIDKLDFVAIPDIAVDGMNNWGLLTFKESMLLWNEKKSTALNKQETALTIAHEISHIWFGGSVTFNWWSYVFLAKGFASYFTYFAVAEIEKEWELEKQFVVEAVQPALFADSFPTASALGSNVTSPSEFMDKLDMISFGKGASILRMIWNMVGPGIFQESLQHYLKTHQFNNTVPEDLWDAFDKFAVVPYKFKEFMATWTNKQGYPVLNVHLRGSDIIITQEQFLMRGKSKTKWYIPITYTTSYDDNKFENTTPSVWMTPRQNELKLKNVIRTNADWIILNNQQTGFYRVRYADNLWQRIYMLLSRDFNDVHVLNRAQMVDDLFSFAEASGNEYAKLFSQLFFLSQETSYSPWCSAFDGITRIFDKLNHPTIKKKFLVSSDNFSVRWYFNVIQHAVGTMMTNFYTSTQRTTDKKDHVATLTKNLATKWACKTGIAECVKIEKMHYKRFKQTADLDSELRETVYCTVLQNSDEVEADWNFLWNLYKKSFVATEKKEIELALACVENKGILKRYLENILADPSEIHKADSMEIMKAILTSNSVGTDTVLDYFGENYSNVFRYCKDFCFESFLQLLASSFKTREQLAKLKKIDAKYHLPPYILKIAEDRIKETEELEKQLVKFFDIKRNRTRRNEIEFGPFLIIFIIARFL